MRSFTAMLPRASHPTAKALIESLLEDEVDHGRVGWAYLEQRRSDGTLTGLEAHLEAIADRTVGAVVRDAAASPEPSDPRAESLGHLGLDEAATLYVDALEQVIMPGLDQVGVGTTPLETCVARWRASTA